MSVKDQPSPMGPARLARIAVTAVLLAVTLKNSSIPLNTWLDWTA